MAKNQRGKSLFSGAIIFFSQLLFLVVVLFSPLPGGAQAEERGLLGAVAAGAGAAKVYDKDTLNVAQLRQCLQMEKDNESFSAVLEEKKAKLNEQNSRLDSLFAELEAKKLYLEENKETKFTSQEEVDKYNSEIESYNSMVSSYNERSDKLNQESDAYAAEVDGLNKDIEVYQQKCAGKNYYEEDYLEASK
jgi:chromosome segregation ATPase